MYAGVAPQKRRDNYWRMMSVELLDELSARIAEDETVRGIARRMGVSARAVIGISEPDIFLEVQAVSDGVRVRRMRSTKRQASFTLDGRTLHNILTGTQNIMIALNKRRLDCIIEKGMTEEFISFLINSLPRISAIYRKLIEEKDKRI
jgi:hypothetical protein